MVLNIKLNFLEQPRNMLNKSNNMLNFWTIAEAEK